jgi:hypothetical protein
MTFNLNQIQELSKWEDAFRTAIHSDYARGVTPKNAERIFEILKEATGTNMILQANCSRCVKDLLKKVGVRYFLDKAEIAENKAKAREMNQTSTKTKQSRKSKIKQ